MFLGATRQRNVDFAGLDSWPARIRPDRTDGADNRKKALTV
jgi:hypothetical protein